MKQQTLRVIIVTSLFWILLDAFLLTNFTDCILKSPCPYQNQPAPVVSGAKLVVKRNDVDSNGLPKDPDSEEGDFEATNLVIDPMDVHSSDEDRDMRSRKLALQEVAASSVVIAATMSAKAANLISYERTDVKVNPDDWPGERGASVMLSSADEELAKARFAENQFDVVRSEKVAINRSVPDLRPHR